MKIKLLSVTIYLFFSLFSNCVFAKAELKLFPTKIIINQGKRAQRVTLINSGDKTGVYEILWIDQQMNEDGSMQVIKEETPPEWSLRPFIRYAPRRVVLKPGEQQIIKIGIKRNIKGKTGELYSHLKVRMLESNLDATEKRMENESDSGKYKISIKATQSVAIPVIWRSERTEFKAALKSATLNVNDRQMELAITRSGAFSTRGYINVFVPGMEEPVSEKTHVVIYPTLSEKNVIIRFIKNLDLNTLINQKVRIEYIEEANPTNILFNTWVNL